jgi:RNA polymerase sigma-70 factor (sigma-E family)
MTEAMELDRSAGSAAAGDALALVYRQRYRYLVGLAYLLLDDRGLAEETVQEAFARTLEGWGRLRRAEDPFAYVRQSVINLSRSALRRRMLLRRRPAEAAADDPGADAGVVAGESRRELVAALRTLPRRQRECVVLRYFQECSTEEAATALGISESAVKTHVQRALAALERSLGGSR